MKKQKRVTYINTAFLPVHIGFCNNAKAWDKEMKRMNVTNPDPFCDDGKCCWFTNSNDDLTILISINRKKAKTWYKSTVYGAIAHEAQHACDTIMRHIGEREPSSEFKAYIVGWLTRRGIEELGL